MKLLTSVSAGLCAATLMAMASPAQAVNMTIYYLDSPSVGFNDPGKGANRRAAFEFAMQEIADSINGSVPITVDAYFIYGNGASWGYDDGWPNQVWRDFSNSQAGVYYPVALANQIAGGDFNTGQSDITVIFNGDLDTYGGTYGERFYYGTNANPGSDVDFVTVSLHAAARGLGFMTLLNPADGGYYKFDSDPNGLPDILVTKLASSKKPVWNTKAVMLTNLDPAKRKKAAQSKKGLRWAGPSLTEATGILVPMYAPKVKKNRPVPYGAVDHFSPDWSRNEVVLPFYYKAVHNLGSARYAMRDMGWTMY